MSYKVFLSKKAEKQLSKISILEQKLIASSINDLLKFSKQSKQIKKLQTPFPGYRKRIGKHRILFEVIKETKEIKIYKIGPRNNIYKIK